MANKNIQIQDVNGNNLYPVSLMKITYAQLKSLRDNSNLVPGMQYRITDYQCTTTQADTRSAGHQFDIIVTADSANKLDEKARAILHEGDTYFANCNLAAWELWYCLDNDTNRFAWVDATNGKGVIYRMIDEWHNDCPYDFKNIQFKRYKITYSSISDLVGTYLSPYNSPSSIQIDNNDSKMFYTFSYLGEFPDGEIKEYKGEILEDASIIGNTLPSDMGAPYGVLNNTIAITYDDNNEHIQPVQQLNNIVFLTYTTDVYYGCYNNSFSEGCYDNSFDNDCHNNSFGNDCYQNILSFDCNGNSFGNSCNDNVISNNCIDNVIGNLCWGNIFDRSCSSNKIDNGICRVNLHDDNNYCHIKSGVSVYTTSNHTLYNMTVAKKTDGTIIEYNEADLIPTVSLTFTSDTNTSVKVYFTKVSYDAKKPDDTIHLIAKLLKEMVYYRNNIYKFEFDNATIITYARIRGTLLDCNKLFSGCNYLTFLDVTKLNTSNVTNMGKMFDGCWNLTSLDLSNFDTSNVTNMYFMFNKCSNLTSLDVSNFNTSKVTDMRMMFNQCSNLTSLDVSNFDTSNVTNMLGMFEYCSNSNITTINVSNWNTSKVINMSYMFLGCSGLRGMNLSNWNTSNVADMSYMFQYATGLISLGSIDTASGWQHKPDKYDYMFDNCPATPKPKWYTA